MSTNFSNNMKQTLQILQKPKLIKKKKLNLSVHSLTPQTQIEEQKFAMLSN